MFYLAKTFGMFINHLRQRRGDLVFAVPLRLFSQIGVESLSEIFVTGVGISVVDVSRNRRQRRRIFFGVLG